MSRGTQHNVHESHSFTKEVPFHMQPNERYWRSLFCGYPDRVILYNTLFTIFFVSGGLLDILLTCDLRHTFLCRIWLHQQQQKLPSRLPSPLTQSCRSRWINVLQPIVTSKLRMNQRLAVYSAFSCRWIFHPNISKHLSEHVPITGIGRARGNSLYCSSQICGRGIQSWPRHKVCLESALIILDY